jgi:hypothetical protein
MCLREYVFVSVCVHSYVCMHRECARYCMHIHFPAMVMSLEVSV